MIKVIKLSRKAINCWFYNHNAQYSGANRFQFKITKPVYYPRRDADVRADPNVHLPIPKLPVKNEVRVPRINYYKVLGVNKKATTQEIKGAYYELAKKFHPDASPTPQEAKSFQEISEAYHVLSDEDHRKNYDRFGTVRNVQPFFKTISLGNNIANKTSRFLSALRTDVRENWNGRGADSKIELRDIPQVNGVNEIVLELKFLQAVHGCTEYIDLRAMQKCPRCNGTARLSNQINIEFCQKCGGKGQYNIKQENGSTMVKVCEDCNGKRCISKTCCQTCDNRGFVVESHRVEVVVPPGSTHNDTIKIANPLNNHIAHVRLKVDKSNYFKREGNNVYTDKYITISQAMLGGKIKVRGLYEMLEVNVGPGTESHVTHCFKGKGIRMAGENPGDHIITFKIRVPKMLTTKQRQLVLALARTEDMTFDGQ